MPGTAARPGQPERRAVPDGVEVQPDAPGPGRVDHRPQRDRAVRGEDGLRRIDAQLEHEAVLRQVVHDLEDPQQGGVGGDLVDVDRAGERQPEPGGWTAGLRQAADHAVQRTDGEVPRGGPESAVQDPAAHRAARVVDLREQRADGLVGRIVRGRIVRGPAVGYGRDPRDRAAGSRRGPPLVAGGTGAGRAEVDAQVLDRPPSEPPPELRPRGLDLVGREPRGHRERDRSGGVLVQRLEGGAAPRGAHARLRAVRGDEHRVARSPVGGRGGATRGDPAVDRRQRGLERVERGVRQSSRAVRHHGQPVTCGPGGQGPTRSPSRRGPVPGGR